MNEKRQSASEPSSAATMTSTHDRNVLMARLFITCAVLIGPVTLMIAVIVYAIYRGEETHPWSHRSVARSTPCELVANADSV